MNSPETTSTKMKTRSLIFACELFAIIASSIVVIEVTRWVMSLP
jgi:hypothetical protein